MSRITRGIPRERSPALGPSGRSGSGRGPTGLLLPLVALLLLPLLPACGEDGTSPGTLRFGQDGEVRIEVSTPIGSVAGDGRLEERITWHHTGRWRLVERISYRGSVGDSTVTESRGDPAAFASSYASLVTLVNESRGIRLFVDELEPDLDPECGSGRSRVTFRIRDAGRDETVEWIRCSTGSLAQLTTRGAGPDPAAGRVIQATMLARDFVLSEQYRSTYAGTVPFGTLARRERSSGGVPQPRVFLSFDDEAPAAWDDFWRRHVGGAAPLDVRWDEEMVIVASVGSVERAGHEVELRRILSVEGGTQLEVFERVPGDFCSPASGEFSPFHVAVAPRTTEPVRFQEVRREEFSCGL